MNNSSVCFNRGFFLFYLKPGDCASVWLADQYPFQPNKQTKICKIGGKSSKISKEGISKKVEMFVKKTINQYKKNAIKTSSLILLRDYWY